MKILYLVATLATGDIRAEAMPAEACRMVVDGLASGALVEADTIDGFRVTIKRAHCVDPNPEECEVETQ